MPVTWAEAEAGDREELMAFVCANPSKHSYDKHRGRYHPSPWALEVQSQIRNLEPPVARRREWLSIGRDPVGIAAVIHYGLDDEKEQFIILAVARAERCASAGYGRVALVNTINHLTFLKLVDGRDCGVFTRVDPRNRSSQRMFEQAGFLNLGGDNHYETWVHALPLDSLDSSGKDNVWPGS